jgi:hypothetical protein
MFYGTELFMKPYQVVKIMPYHAEFVLPWQPAAK